MTNTYMLKAESSGGAGSMRAYTHRELAESLIRAYRQDIAKLQEQLEPLEAGTMRIGESRPGGPWVDITERQIQLLRDGIQQQHETGIADLEASLANAYRTGRPPIYI
jgi:hypothetical protein